MNSVTLREAATILAALNDGRAVAIPHYTGAIEHLPPEAYAKHILTSMLATEPATAHPIVMAVLFGDRSQIEMARTNLLEVVVAHAEAVAARFNKEGADAVFARQDDRHPRPEAAGRRLEDRATRTALDHPVAARLAAADPRHPQRPPIGGQLDRPDQEAHSSTPRRRSSGTRRSSACRCSALISPGDRPASRP